MVFGRALSCDFVHDDWTILVNNTHLNPPTWAALGYYWTHVSVNLYTPVPCTIWELLAHAAYLPDADPNGNHLNPAVFHLGGVLIHALAALALYRLLFRITNHRWAACAGALAFAIHPIQAEAGTFIGALNNVTMGLFSLLALGDYVEAVKAGLNEEGGPSRTVLYFRAMFFLVLAMLSKPTAVVVPAVAFILDLAMRGRARAAVVSVIPFAALILPCLVWTRIFQPGAVALQMTPLWFRPLVAGDSISFYVGKILLPRQLCQDYGRTPALVYAHPMMTCDGIVTLALLLVAWRLWRRAPLVAASILAFVVALLPNSGLVTFDNQRYSTVADRYAYLAMIGPALLVAWGLSRPFVSVRRLPVVAISALFLVGLSLGTVHQIGYWRDDRALFAHTVEVNPNSAMGFEGLAFGLLRSDPAAAIKAADTAIRLDPANGAPHLTIATADFIQGDRAAGIRQLRESIRLDPNERVTHKILASALSETGDTAAALEEYNRCLKLDPGDAAVHSDMAALLAENGQLEEAIDQYHQALAINSSFEAAKVGLAMAERQLHEKSGVH